MSKTVFFAALIAIAPSAAFAQDWVVEPAPPPPIVETPGMVIETAPVAGPEVYDYVEAPPPPVYHRYVEEPARVYRGRRLVVGEALPPGVAIYPAPPEYGATEYRYTILNHRPVLVDPYTRRVIEILD